jgi:HAD superfamily hydrolase (TIGR01490 family)
MRAEENQMKEVKHEENKPRGIAAFFDLDGTLIAGPSLERRFFQELRCRRVIGGKNYLWWMAQALRLVPQGISKILQTNKMYLRGVAAAGRARDLGEGMKPAFFAAAIERLAWHAQRGDAIVIVSGTLEPLARRAARELGTILIRRGIKAEVHVCAIRLEENHGRWTGQIIGEAMFGGAKARAARRLAAQMGFDLKQSYAYGDSAQDWWMLDAVGNPWAVNPSPGLSQVAREKNWPILRWNKRKEFTKRAQRRAEAVTGPGSSG